MDKASFIVKDRDGNIVEVGPQVHVDRVSALAESRRLRAKHGSDVTIDSSQILAARSRFLAREELSLV